MTFTVLADFFLILFDARIIGQLLFCVTHACYIARARRGGERQRIITALLIAAPVFFLFDVTVALSAAYACLFVQSLYLNFKCGHENRRLILTGLTLFLLCDVNVLLFNLPGYVNFPASAAKTAYCLIWVFYLPSQLLIALSGCKRKAAVHENGL